MVERTEIEKFVRWLIASDILYRPLKSLGEKGIRRLDKTAKNIADLLKQEAEIGERVVVRIEEREEAKARTLKEGIDKFSEKYPKHGEILKGLIKEERTKRNNYLIYGLKEKYKLAEEDYIQVMMDLGFTKREAAEIYPHILSISGRLEKASEHEEKSILLKEQSSEKGKRKK